MEFLDLFRDWDDVEEYREQTVIFSEGDFADVLYVIIAGKVELTLEGSTLSTEKEGGIIGELAILDTADRSHSAKALTDVKLARLNQDQFKALIKQNSDFSFHMMAVLAGRLRAVDRFIITQFD